MHRFIYPASLIFILSLPLLILSKSIQENTYDFLIIGGGTGGLAVARRLSEHTFSVLVLESGDEPKKGTEIPAYRFAADPQVTFRYNSVPQTNAALRNNGIVPIVSGRMLGGTSNINQMQFNRGHQNDYDHWANLTGDASWSYSNMLKYFKRAENYQGDYPSDEHGTSGPLTISRPKYAPGLEFWLKAGESLGYEVADPNGPQKISFSVFEFTKKRGRRVSSLEGYINPIRSTSPNLQIATNTNATKIIFENNRAVGVDFTSTSPLLQNIQPRRVFARKEIILSAGAYGSPQLLLRSGIGPKDSLREANISVVADLPVGLNFQDHVLVSLPFILNTDEVIMDEERDLNESNLKLYEMTGDGPYSSVRGTTGQAFIASSVAKSEGEEFWSDVQIVMEHSKQAYLGLKLVGNDSVASGEGPMSAWVSLSRPKSRGSIQLNPEDPNGPPMIDFQYFSDKRDVQKMLDGIDTLLKIFEKTPAYRKLEARFPRNINLPECNKLTFRSRQFWECYIKYTARGGCHPAGTCRMGRSNSSNAVVDSKLRVIGIEGLSIADASVFIKITNANPQAAVYAVAEKAADMILSRWEGLE